MITVYGDPRSGNCLKVLWLLRHQQRAFTWVDVDFLAGATRTPEFLSLNSAGQVPAIVLEDGRPLGQSNAILLYLAGDGPLVPCDAYQRALMQAWLFWEQYSHEPYLAVRRFQKLYLQKPDGEIDPKLMKRGKAALARMEAHLDGRSWLVGSSASLADLALLPYTALAPQGGFDLKPYPRVSAWIRRVFDTFAVPEEERSGDVREASQ